MAQLLSALPVGSLVKDTGFTYSGSTPIFRILEHGHSGDPAGSTALEFKDVICQKCFDASESDNSFGNYKYSLSNILQWLNSDGAAGSWFTPQHSTDRAPSSAYIQGGSNPYDTEAGFLTFFPDNLKSNLLSTTKTSYEDYRVTTKATKLFLFSGNELGIGDLNGGGAYAREGSVYAYYATGGDARRQKGSNYYIRSKMSNSESTRYVDTNGQCGYYTNSSNAYVTRGIVAAFCIPSDLLVSDSADVDGAYTFVWNTAPTITPTTTDYGNVTSPPSITCTIADADGDTFTYTVKVNGVTQASGSGTASKTFALDMQSYWGMMALGTNTITVTATDSKSATTTATYTMNKTNSSAPVPTTDLVNNTRKETSFYIGFQIGQDPDGDSQTVVAQVSASSDMSNPTEFTGVEKLVSGAWLPVQTLTNADAGASLRIQVTGQTVGNTIYVRLKDTDSGSGTPVYTSTYAIVIGSVLEFDTLPITRTDKPSLVVAYLNKTMPADATLTMYACNNANDGAPTWEAITEGETHQFTNKTKTAANWGVSVKTSIAAGSTAGEISVSAVGLGVL